MPPLRILINGAGIAGNSLAFWLSRQGHSVTVLEQAPVLRTEGLQIDLRGPAIDVVERMGLTSELRSKCLAEQGVEIVGTSGKRWAYFGAKKSPSGMQTFTSEWEVMRGDLCQVLYSATKDRATYLFGTSIESYDDEAESVNVRYTDGTTHRFDLVVGADGVWSRLRKLMLGPKFTDSFTPLEDLYVAYFTVPYPMQPGERFVSSLCMAPGNKGMMTRRQSEERLQVYLGGKSDLDDLKQVYRGDIGKQKEAMSRFMRGCGSKVDDILNRLDSVNDFYLERIGLVNIDTWWRGRVALVGDAAWCPSVMTGMGTTSSILGSYVMAGEISKRCGGPNGKDQLPAALQAYEENFRPFMDEVTKDLRNGQGGFSMPSSEFGITLFNFALGVVSFLRLDYLGRFIFNIKLPKWQLPNYEM